MIYIERTSGEKVLVQDDILKDVLRITHQALMESKEHSKKCTDDDDNVLCAVAYMMYNLNLHSTT